MRFGTIGMALFGVMLATSAGAQPAPAPAAAPAPPIAAGKLASVTDAPRYFKVVSVTLAAGAKSSVTGPSSILYQMTGSTAVTFGGETKTLNAGEGMFIAAGMPVQLQAGPAGPSALFHYFLAAPADLDRPAETAPATVKELYRSAAPIPDLKAGAYDINLVRATFAPQMAITPPHHRSGAALYYIVSGTPLNTIDGVTTPRPPGSFIYEPFSLVHQWSNPGNEPGVRIVFNINPEGVAAVLQGAPANGP